MSEKTDRFVVATYALWAGDFKYAETLLRESRESLPLFAHDKAERLPEEIFDRITKSRLGQIRRRRAEFRRLAADFEARDAARALSGDPLTLETPHMRATVWQLRSREFRMQAYLTDLSWESNLFVNVHMQSAKADPDAALRREASKLEPELGVTWTEPGMPPLEVEVTDLGQVDVSMLWTDPEPPPNSDAVTAPLIAFLRRLDPVPQHRSR
jgi:hypothetical protein